MNGIELKKYSDTVEDRKTIEEFLDWANGKEIMLGSYVKPFKNSDTERMFPLPVTSIDLLNQYFEINAMELDRERRQLLKEARPTRPMKRTVHVLREEVMKNEKKETIPNKI